MSKLDRTVWYDCVYLFVLKNSGNMMALLMHLMIAYFCMALYFGGNTPTNRLLKDVLIKKKTYFFLQPYIRDQPIYHVVQNFAMFFFSLFQLFVLSMG